MFKYDTICTGFRGPLLGSTPFGHSVSIPTTVSKFSGRRGILGLVVFFFSIKGLDYFRVGHASAVLTGWKLSQAY